jgi:hypothetical protein
VSAAEPARFITMLMHLDQNVTSRLVNNRDHRLGKGPAGHLDLPVVGGLMAANLYPSTHHLRRVPAWTIHKSTFHQWLCLPALFALEASAWAIMFPLLIALLVSVRQVLGRIFAPRHLEALDATGVPEEERVHWTGRSADSGRIAGIGRGRAHRVVWTAR